MQVFSKTPGKKVRGKLRRTPYILFRISKWKKYYYYYYIILEHEKDASIFLSVKTISPSLSQKKLFFRCRNYLAVLL